MDGIHRCAPGGRELRVSEGAVWEEPFVVPAFGAMVSGTDTEFFNCVYQLSPMFEVISLYGIVDRVVFSAMQEVLFAIYATKPGIQYSSA